MVVGRGRAVSMELGLWHEGVGAGASMMLAPSPVVAVCMLGEVPACMAVERCLGAWLCVCVVWLAVGHC